MRPVRATLAVCCCAVLLGCSATSAGRPVAPPDEASARYGQAAPRNPEGVTYQPDVVVVDGGSGAVRSVSANGLVWTVEAGAAGLDQLDVGEVAFLTSRAAGRVLAKAPSGDGVVLTLAPVQLEEVIRDGHIKIDTAIDPSNVTVQEIPEMPGALGEPTEADVDTPPGLTGPPLLGSRAPALPPARQGEAEISIGNFEINATTSSSGVGLSAAMKPGGAVKLGADVKLGFRGMRATYDVLVAGGRITDSTTMLIHGIESLEVSIYAGVANGVDDNQKVKIEVPVEFFNEPVVIFGIPMVLNAKMKAVFEMALVGKNATLSASGKWGLAGTVGKSGDTPAQPGFSVIHSIIDSIKGISLGPSGMAVGVEFKLMLGLGVPGAAAGPYTKLRVGVGVANGSALGSPLAQCSSATLSVKGGGGVGMSLGETMLAELTKFLPNQPKIKADLEAEKLWSIVERSQTRPDVPLCKGR